MPPFLCHVCPCVLLLLCVSLIAYTEQYLEYDPFVTSPEPSNPWTSDDPTFWDLEARYDHCQWICQDVSACCFVVVFIIMVFLEETLCTDYFKIIYFSVVGLCNL